ncbi:MAG TPA: ATP-binding cassette domain-containing protein, partial [Longimicrobiaceae bacterium]|nr:ATP-binding cassette domain-containing protein [Longimicrobiaceae bacterium]
ILYRDRPLAEYPVRELRCRVGFVFQTPVMFPGTVRENLRRAAELADTAGPDLEERMEEALRLSELDLTLADRPGERLSVGQRQRANLARALMTAPETLLLDEPTSALDPETADRLMETVLRLCREAGLTVVLVTHRFTEARRVSDLTVVLDHGRLLETGPTAALFARAAHPRVRALLQREG